MKAKKRSSLCNRRGNGAQRRTVWGGSQRIAREGTKRDLGEETHKGLPGRTKKLAKQGTGENHEERGSKKSLARKKMAVGFVVRARGLKGKSLLEISRERRNGGGPRQVSCKKTNGTGNILLPAKKS